MKTSKGKNKQTHKQTNKNENRSRRHCLGQLITRRAAFVKTYTNILLLPRPLLSPLPPPLPTPSPLPPPPHLPPYSPPPPPPPLPPPPCPVQSVTSSIHNPLTRLCLRPFGIYQRTVSGNWDSQIFSASARLIASLSRV